MANTLKELKSLTNKLLQQELPNLKELTEKLKELDKGTNGCVACEVYRAVAYNSFEKYYNALITLEMQMQLLNKKMKETRKRKR